ncbi:MAG: PIN domain-containing protein [bacterium]|nr:PIN domain-containing protein [bacterium]
MKKYYIDTNIILRYILKDDLALWDKAKNYFLSAKNQQIKIVLIPEIIIEVEYVLRKKYKQNRNIITRCLYYFIQTSYFDLTNRTILQNALLAYIKTNIDLVDLYLFFIANSNNAEVLSFDKDFKKLQKLV